MKPVQNLRISAGCALTKFKKVAPQSHDSIWLVAGGGLGQCTSTVHSVATVMTNVFKKKLNYNVIKYSHSFSYFTVMTLYFNFFKKHWS